MSKFLSLEEDQPLCRANRDKCFCPPAPAFNAEMVGEESASREKSGRNPVTARRANNATCYAYFLAERGWNAARSLGRPYFVGACPPFAFTAY